MQKLWDKFAGWFHWKTTDEIRVWWRLWSVNLGILGTTITTALVAFPDWAINAWSMMPYEARQYIPQQYMPLIGVGIFVLSMISRFIKQHKATAVLAEKKSLDILEAKAEIRDGTGT